MTVTRKLKAVASTSTNSTNRGHFPAIIPFYLARISSARLRRGCRARSAVSSVLWGDAHRLSGASISITNEGPFTCGATAHCSLIVMNRQDTNTLSLKIHPSLFPPISQTLIGKHTGTIFIFTDAFCGWRPGAGGPNLFLFMDVMTYVCSKNVSYCWRCGKRRISHFIFPYCITNIEQLIFSCRLPDTTAASERKNGTGSSKGGFKKQRNP